MGLFDELIDAANKAVQNNQADQQQDGSQEKQQQQQYQDQRQQQQQQQQQPQQYQQQQRYTGQQQQPEQPRRDDGQGIHLPPQLLEIINKYVDTFAPGISQGVEREIAAFQNATLSSLEQHVKDVIIGIFHGDTKDFQSSSNINEFKAARVGPGQQDGANLPQYNYPPTNVVASRDSQGTNVNMPRYGERGLPFAGGSSAEARQATPVDPEAPRKQKNIFESALSTVKTFAKEAVDNAAEGVEHQVKNMANSIDEITDHVEDKVAQIVPDIREKVAEVLRQLHTGLADKMTQAALACVKMFLASAIKVEDLAEEAMEGVQTLLQGFLGGGNQQAQDGVPKGPAGVLSNTLSGGLTAIRRNARVDFRHMLSKIEEELFNHLPDGLKGPLSKIFGGNPFDATINTQQQQQQSGGSGIFSEIGEKIKQILERIQQALRDRVLEVVSGGHRRLEDQAWGNVQDAVVGKVQQYVPGVRVKLQDDPQ